MINPKNIERFTTNLFAFPNGYFEEHTAEELDISEEERQELIKLHVPHSQAKRKSKEDRLAEFKKALSEDW